jgi:prepilin-type N-terminal cleavage/methylation domain-containing protein
MSHKKQQGFTIIELLLAMTAIAFILLSVLYAILHAANLIGKGTAVRTITQIGRQQIDAIAKDLRYGSGFTVGGTNRLCVGGKSYIWNVPGSSVNLFTDNTRINFVVANATMKYCDALTNPKISRADIVELVNNTIAVQELTVTKPIVASPIYELTLTLSTDSSDGVNRPSVTVVGGENVYSCSPASGQYCAFGEFTTSVYARGKEN